MALLSGFIRRAPVRQTVFGLEDGIVSTLGVIVGIAAGTNSRRIVIISAFVVVMVESLSMAAGTFLSDRSEMEVEKEKGTKVFRKPLVGSMYMGLSYVIGGFVSILPFFFTDPAPAIIPSIMISILALFIVGFVKGKIADIDPFKSGLEMSLISISAAVLGYVIGKLVGAEI